MTKTEVVTTKFCLGKYFPLRGKHKASPLLAHIQNILLIKIEVLIKPSDVIAREVPPFHILHTFLYDT